MPFYSGVEFLTVFGGSDGQMGGRKVSTVVLVKGAISISSTQRFYNQRFYKKTMTSPTNK
jgi:hypothetical protein